MCFTLEPLRQGETYYISWRRILIDWVSKKTVYQRCIMDFKGPSLLWSDWLLAKSTKQSLDWRCWWLKSWNVLLSHGNIKSSKNTMTCLSLQRHDAQTEKRFKVPLRANTPTTPSLSLSNTHHNEAKSSFLIWLSKRNQFIFIWDGGWEICAVSREASFSSLFLSSSSCLILVFVTRGLDDRGLLRYGAVSSSLSSLSSLSSSLTHQERCSGGAAGPAMHCGKQNHAHITLHYAGN